MEIIFETDPPKIGLDFNIPLKIGYILGAIVVAILVQHFASDN